MQLSEAAKAFINHCYKDGTPVSCKPFFNVKYQINGMEVKFTESVFEEIKNSELVKVSNQTEKQVSLCGIEGMTI